MTDVGPGVVVVLFRTAPYESRALTSLTAALRASDDVRVLVQDNSAVVEPGRPLPPVVDQLESRPDNPGLAEAYSTASEDFAARGHGWMMVLDQDTALTREYLDEVLDITSGRRSIPDEVAVLAPRLTDGGRVISPHRRVRLRICPVTGAPGVVDGWVTHLNSGSVLRLEAVREIGGFPDEYPLDYLDHALSARLRAAGGRTWVLGSTLDHRLSLLDRNELSTDRLASILDAEHRYHVEFGSRADVAWLATRLWAGAGLSIAHLRPTPDAGLEWAAAVRATRATLSRCRRGNRGRARGV